MFTMVWFDVWLTGIQPLSVGHTAPTTHPEHPTYPTHAGKVLLYHTNMKQLVTTKYNVNSYINSVFNLHIFAICFIQPTSPYTHPTSNHTSSASHPITPSIHICPSGIGFVQHSDKLTILEPCLENGTSAEWWINEANILTFQKKVKNFPPKKQVE